MSREFWRKAIPLGICLSLLTTPLVGCATGPAPVVIPEFREFTNPALVPPDVSKSRMTPEAWTSYGQQMETALAQRIDHPVIKSLAELGTPEGVANLKDGFAKLDGFQFQGINGESYELQIQEMPSSRSLKFDVTNAGVGFQTVGGFRVNVLDARPGKQNVSYRDFEVGVATQSNSKQAFFVNVMETRTFEAYRGHGIAEQTLWLTNNALRTLSGVEDGNYLTFGVITHDASTTLLEPEVAGQTDRVKVIRSSVVDQVPITRMAADTSGKTAKTSIVSVQTTQVGIVKPFKYFEFMIEANGRSPFPTPSAISSPIPMIKDVEAEWEKLTSIGGADWGRVIELVGPNGIAIPEIAPDVFPGFSEEALGIIRVNGLPATPFQGDIVINGNPSLGGWFEIRGTGNPQDWRGIRCPILVNTRTGTVLKVATTDPEADTLATRDLPLVQVSLKRVHLDTAAKQVQIVDLIVGNKQMKALQMPLFTDSPAARLAAGKINVAQAEKFLEQGLLADLEFYKLTNVAHMGDWHDLMLSPQDQIFILGFSNSFYTTLEMQEIFGERLMKIILSSYQDVAARVGIPWQHTDVTEFLRSQNRMDLLPTASQVARIALTPVAGAFGADEVLLLEERGVSVLSPNRAVEDSVYVDITDYAVSSAGKLPRVPRLLRSAGSGVLNFFKKSAEGMVYIMAADTLLKAMNPAEHPVEKLKIPSNQIRLDHYKDDCQKDIVVQQNLDKLFGSVFDSKQFWANRFQSDTDEKLRPELWLSKWQEEKALLDVYSGVPLPKLAEIRQQYRANVVQDLIQNSLIGWKKLEIPDPADPREIENFPFNEEIYISATSADQSKKTDNHLIVWTAVPEANNRSRMVTLLEMVQPKQGDAWTIVQKSNEPLTIKINGQDRTAKLLQFAGNLYIKIDAAGK